MFIKQVNVGDQVYVNVPVDSLDELGVPEEQQEVLIAEAQAEQARELKIRQIRTKIKEQAGDDMALLGTTSDMAQVTVYALCKLIIAIQKSDSFDDTKQAMTEFQPMAKNFLSSGGSERKVSFTLLMFFW